MSNTFCSDIPERRIASDRNWINFAFFDHMLAFGFDRHHCVWKTSRRRGGNPMAPKQDFIHQKYVFNCRGLPFHGVFAFNHLCTLIKRAHPPGDQVFPSHGRVHQRLFQSSSWCGGGTQNPCLVWGCVKQILFVWVPLVRRFHCPAAWLLWLL